MCNTCCVPTHFTFLILGCNFFWSDLISLAMSLKSLKRYCVHIISLAIFLIKRTGRLARVIYTLLADSRVFLIKRTGRLARVIYTLLADSRVFLIKRTGRLARVIYTLLADSRVFLIKRTGRLARVILTMLFWQILEFS
uniref:Uncharacterized protein n=1 Tax=Cacopsylla melanoneura TaxID=428564 RepID=A0A8D9BAE6_9HEMI